MQSAVSGTAQSNNGRFAADATECFATAVLDVSGTTGGEIMKQLRISLAILLSAVAATACTGAISMAPTPSAGSGLSPISSHVSGNPGGFTTSVPNAPKTPSSALQLTSSTSISLGQPPGTYTLPRYTLCEKQFAMSSFQNLYIYPDIPRSLLHVTAAGDYGFVLVIGGDCRHGGTVSAEPKKDVKVASLIAATDGKPLVAQVIYNRGKTGTVTLTPSSGPVVTIEVE